MAGSFPGEIPIKTARVISYNFGYCCCSTALEIEVGGGRKISNFGTVRTLYTIGIQVSGMELRIMLLHYVDIPFNLLSDEVVSWLLVSFCFCSFLKSVLSTIKGTMLSIICNCLV